MRLSNRKIIGLIGVGLVAAILGAGFRTEHFWTFDDETTGAIAQRFTNEVGRWVVVASDSGKALAQTAKNPDATFNVTLVSEPRAKDLDISVKLKAIAGEFDQGGGVVWRARDAKNYYIARYNPLEDNFRVYKVVAGKRTQLASADIPHTSGWHTLSVTMRGDHIECSFDGKKHLDVTDSTFPDAGRIGLWSKSDAQTQFDDLTLVE